MTISGKGLAFLTSMAVAIRGIDAIQPHKLTQQSFLQQLEAASCWLIRYREAREPLLETEQAELRWLVEHLQDLVRGASDTPPPRFYNPS